jgi:3-methyladenine DNA glycosylase/8-oxoguanine DNA glycosylase
MPELAELRVEGPLDLRATLSPLCHGRSDPTSRFVGSTFWRATRTADGPAVQAVRADPAAGAVRCAAWGPGAPRLVAGLADLVGAGDDLTGWEEAVRAARGPGGPPGGELVAELAARFPGLRLPRTNAVWEACVPAVLEQKVTGLEAKRSYREVVEAASEPAPVPAGGPPLRLPPAPASLAVLEPWVWHRAGVERKRAATLVRAAQVAARLEEAAGMDPRSAAARLRAVPGVGPWTAAEVALVALADPDAVSVGDYHLPDQVSWALAGRARGDDATMLRLLEPWRGHRARVLRLLAVAGIRAPRFGPRLAPRSIRAS